MNNKESERLWMHLSKERADQMREWATELNLTLSQFLAMASWLGAKHMMGKLNGDTDLRNDFK